MVYKSYEKVGGKWFGRGLSGVHRESLRAGLDQHGRVASGLGLGDLLSLNTRDGKKLWFHLFPPAV